MIDQQGIRLMTPAAGRTSAETSTGDDRTAGAAWRIRRPLFIYALSRLLTLAVSALIPARYDVGLLQLLTQWDGDWFLRVVREGYPSQIPEVGGHVLPTTIPFFPLFPLTARFVSWLLPISDALAAIVVALAFGAVAVVVVHRLAAFVAGQGAADRGVALFCFFPGSMVLSMAYAEGAMVALSAGCLLALLQRRWLVAGICAALATATRPTALVLVVACMWQAWIAVRERREWRSLVAPALAPAGILGFFAFLWARTGEPLAYIHAEEAWKVGASFGRSTAELVHTFARAPLSEPVSTIVFLSVAFAAVSGVLLVRRQWPSVLSVYAFSILAFSIASRSDGLRPRDVLTAFPLILVVGAVTKSRHTVLRNVFGVALAASMFFHNVTSWHQP